jgi:hypothetical protein
MFVIVARVRLLILIAVWSRRFFGNWRDVIAFWGPAGW